MSDPLPSGGPAVGRFTFDLGPEAATTRAYERRTNGIFLGFGFALTFFFFLGAVSLPRGSSGEVFLAVFAAILGTLTSLGAWFTFTGGIVGIALDDLGVTVNRQRRASTLVRWSDARFSVDLTEISVAPTQVVSAGDPRALEPQWVRFRYPFRQEIVVPKGLESLLISEGRAHGLRVESSPVLLFDTGRNMPQLSSRDVTLGDSKVPNGLVYRLRGTEAS